MKVKEETEKAGLKLNTQKNEDQGIWFHYLWQIDGKQWKQRQTFFSWVPESLQMVTAAMKLKDVCSLEGNKSRQHIKKQRHQFTDKGPYSQSCVFFQ